MGCYGILQLGYHIVLCIVVTSWVLCLSLVIKETLTETCVLNGIILRTTLLVYTV